MLVRTKCSDPFATWLPAALRATWTTACARACCYCVGRSYSTPARQCNTRLRAVRAAIHRAVTMVQLDENKFLTELNKMYERHKTAGSVWVTMKSSNNKPRSKKTQYPQEDYKCLVRAVAGKKDKKREIATLVAASQVSMLWAQAGVCTGSICKLADGWNMLGGCNCGSTDGKREFATLCWCCPLSPQYAKFAQSMIVIMKANMDALKKKEKSKAARKEA